MIRKLYDWVFKLAEHKRASSALAGVSFIESSFFPIPPDVLLIPMVLAKRHKWIFYAGLCTIASVLGAFLGYYIGAALYDTIGKPIVGFNLLTFAIVSVIGRGFRFFLVSFLIYWLGEPVREFIEKRLGLMFTLGMIALIGGFVAIKFLF